MNKKINESFIFLITEYKRLKLKKEKKIISKEEEETLDRLKLFIGNNKDE